MSGPLTLDLTGGSETLHLSTIEVYNWGPFNRYHRAHIDPAGTAVIGPTGSGKTTLVDALMTLVVAHPRYNLASTGGHDSDRDLESYVRGVLGQGSSANPTTHISRPAKVVTGLAATFSRPGRSVTLGAVLWTDSSSRSVSDIKKRWLISEAEGESLETWLTIHAAGGDRALKKHRDTTPRLQLWESKSKYLAQLRRLFDISENAFALLNRAAGLKQLDSIDAIFRDLVLDDRSLFAAAGKVVENFAQLVEIRAELETARRQHRALLPLRELVDRHTKAETELMVVRRLQGLLDPWYAQAAAELWAERRAGLEIEVVRRQEALSDHEQAAARLDRHAEGLRAAFDDAGGAELHGIDQQRADVEDLLASRQRRLAVVRASAATVGITLGAPTPHHLDQVRTAAAGIRSQLDAATDAIAEQFGRAAGELANASDELQANRDELAEVRTRPDSNIPSRYHRFRAELAAAMGTGEDELPFVAELVEVKPDERRWRGAIERAIGGHRLRIMVAEDRARQALRWINNRDNKLHVRLARAEAEPAVHRGPHHDGFVGKLTLKAHRHQRAVAALLASIDRHCVEDPDQLTTTEHAMTPEGLFSDRAGRFEKQDQRRLDGDWMTGFSNHARVAAIEARIAELDRSTVDLRARLDTCHAEQKAHNAQLAATVDLVAVTDEEVDVITPAERRDDLEARRARLLDPDSDLARAEAEWRTARRRLDQAREAVTAAGQDLGGAKSRLTAAIERETDARDRVGEGLGDDDAELASRRLTPTDGLDPDAVHRLQQRETLRLNAEADTQREVLAELERRLVDQMNKAKNEDTGELVETGTTLADLDDYLDRLQVLEDEALPARQSRFLDYLRHSSDEGVASILAGVDAEVDQIESRIRDLNRTLQRVDFEPGRYLELRPRKVTQAKLLELVKAQKKLTAARLNDETGEVHYAALTAVIDHLRAACDAKHTLWARSILDPRHRLTFTVAALDRVTDEVLEERTSSEGGSGGEKEIIASYVLTASLAYALCPDGASKPLFGTIVLDEAFSKSSEAVASRIIEALGVFGLHPLFVTPNKELRLLRANTRSAILVNKRGAEARLLTITWDELDRARPGTPDEDPPATSGRVRAARAG